MSVKPFRILILINTIIILSFIASLYWPRTIEKIEGINALVPVTQATAPKTNVHYIKSGEVTTLEAFTFAGGSIFKSKTLTHGAILIEHPKGNVLIDSGLGKNAQAQFDADMPNYMKSLMAFTQITDTKSAILEKELALPTQIILTHAHWDHASALEDFGAIDVLVNQQELDYVNNHGIPDIFPSQIENKAFNWSVFEFSNTAYGVFDKSYDIYNDGSIVVVPLFGHSPGSVGIFVNNKNAQRFFIGDAVWNIQAIEKRKPKMWVSGLLTDKHGDATTDVIAMLHELQKQNPNLIIVPAHDSDAWK